MAGSVAKIRQAWQKVGVYLTPLDTIMTSLFYWKFNNTMLEDADFCKKKRQRTDSMELDTV